MILQPLAPSQERKLSALETDGLSVFTLYGGKIRGACATASRLCAQMARNHGLGVIETLALGQAAICAGLLSSTIKGDDKLALRIDCEGPLRGLQVEALSNGELRGRVFTDGIAVDRPVESADLAPWIGPGYLTITRFPGTGAPPFTGRTALVHSRVAEDLAEYYLRSEQTRTAFSASLKLDAEGDVAGAGGLYLQALPGADDEALSFVERVLSGAPSPGASFSEGITRRDYLVRCFLFAEIDFLGEFPLSFSCRCDRSRFLAIIRGMDAHDREEAYAASPSGNEIEVACRNCGTAYSFTRPEVEG